MEKFHEAVGAIHLHSSYSDGTKTIPEIAGIAGQKCLDYLMFSDHNTLEPKTMGLEGWYGNVLVLIGCELNDPEDRNHYLAFRIETLPEKGLPAHEYVKKVHRMGGFGMIAHPAEKRSFSEAYPPYPWTAWEVEEFDGIEIWNQLSEWIEGITRRNLFWRIWHPLRSIRFPVWETLARWDQYNRKRRIVGVGGIDVHAYHYRLGFLPLEIYPYKVQFRSIRTHLLLKKDLKSGDSKLDFRESEALIFEALSQGRCFVSNHSIGDARGFVFRMERGDSCHPMGSRVPAGEGTFIAVSPLPGEIVLLRDGHVIKSVTGKRLEMKACGPGVYRIEVFRKRRGWVYSNPVVLIPG